MWLSKRTVSMSSTLSLSRTLLSRPEPALIKSKSPLNLVLWQMWHAHWCDKGGAGKNTKRWCYWLILCNHVMRGEDKKKKHFTPQTFKYQYILQNVFQCLHLIKMINLKNKHKKLCICFLQFHLYNALKEIWKLDYFHSSYMLLNIPLSVYYKSR